ncbi:hypothetical protein EYZ11_005732 [Aspergillus tanneri]|uniref:C2H2-type domain-containing protein n=1 Tax=Aspergillus tanneri TaxID=1220188 RepID=A0A4S3JH77_9EURO|nr:uncharacterized protein ATNIH1004_004213 [Aspergillus tanneri]KAA8648328.1 hypothetical protein ATNIH1004_004213 [Aspergillus tanneri]THC94786.1 hypothetical protein EYZ11_005732 [Aspergillus tanneri]
MGEFSPFTDSQPQISHPDSLPMQQDYQLYPSDSESYVTPMTENQPPYSSKGLYMLSPAVWPQTAVPSDLVSPFPMDISYPAVVTDLSAPSWGGNVPSVSGSESPQSSSDSWWSVGCYMSPPQEFWDSPSPGTSAEFDRSVAPSEVLQPYPDPESMVEFQHDSSYTPQPIVNNCQLPLDAPDASGNVCNSPSPSAAPQELVISHPLSAQPQTSKNTSPHRVTKRSPRGKSSRKHGRTSAPRSATKSKATGKKNASTYNRLFVCSFSHYGCMSTFVSKNEWKRHVASQHVQLGFYRCDVGRCNLNNLNHDKSPVSDDGGSSCDEVRLVNDFNRKDLFTQHQRRMHAPWVQRNRKHPVTEEERNEFEQTLDDVRARCWHEQRTAPLQSQCGFCGQEFAGPRSWCERMEHVGRHYEKGDVSVDIEPEDVALREWAAEAGVVRLVDGKWRLSSLVEK